MSLTGLVHKFILTIVGVFVLSYQLYESEEGFRVLHVLAFCLLAFSFLHKQWEKFSPIKEMTLVEC